MPSGVEDAGKNAVKAEYSEDELAEMLTKAKAMGFSLESGSELEKLTIRELDVLVNQRM